MIAQLVALTSPGWGATLTVTTAADTVDPVDGVLSFREALGNAVASDVIVFDSAVFPVGIVTDIAVEAAFGTLIVDASVRIEGNERVRLDGSATMAPTHGLRIDVGTSEVYGLHVTSFPGHGIVVRAGSGIVVGEDAPDRRLTIDTVDESGIQVGDGGAIIGLAIEGVDIAFACGSAGNSPCGGIELSAGTLTDDPTIRRVSVTSTLGNPSKTQGIGILVNKADDTTISESTIGGVGAQRNNSHGIFVGGGSNVPSIIVDNVISGNNGSGVHLAQNSDLTVVQRNLIGLNAAGTAASSNLKHGISVFAGEGLVLLDNVISGNDESGIHMTGALAGNSQSDQIIEGNFIGTDATGAFAVPNGHHGIVSHGDEGSSGIGYTTEGSGNVVSGNGRHGVALFDGAHAVHGNRIGTDPTGTIAIPNGTATGDWAGLLLVGDGTLVGGSQHEVAGLPDLGAMNQISGNTDVGIWISGATGTSIHANLVGAAADGDDPLGNGGHGIFVDDTTVLTAFAAGDVFIGGPLVIDPLTLEVDFGDRNVIVDNGGDGIRVEGLDMKGHRIAGSLLGRGLLGSVAGNGGDGMVLVDVVDGKLQANHAEGNGARGIHLLGTTGLMLSRNTATDNELCGMWFDNANVAAEAAAVGAGVEVAHPHSISGTIGMAMAPVVEIFWDADDEASIFVGTGLLTADGFTLKVPDPRFAQPFPVGGRYSITMTENGETSSIGAFCNDDCAATGVGSCNDGNQCTDDVCQLLGLGCSITLSPVGTACNDGNQCTRDAMGCTDCDECDAAGECAGLIIIQNCMGDGCFDGDVARDCSDADPCGTGEFCDIDTDMCAPAPGPACHDDNKCTGDQCDPVHGCVNPPRPTTFACAEPNQCLTPGVCDGGGGCATSGEALECPYQSCASGEAVCSSVANAGCMILMPSCNDGFCGPDDLSVCRAAGQDCDPAGGGLDTDDDGIPNIWETIGIDDDCDPATPPYILDTDPNRDTVFLELAYMVADDHTHEPLPGAEELIEDAFANAPDGGVEMTMEVDDPLPHYRAISTYVNIPDTVGCDSWTAVHLLKRDYFDPVRHPFYHYGVMGHSFGHCEGNTGAAEGIGNNDFVVTLGNFEEEAPLALEDQASTIMHELGHNLGLLHGGNLDIARLVIHQSVMSYTYGFGLTEWPECGRALDYSREDFSNRRVGAMLTMSIDEGNLDELRGFQTTNEVDFRYSLPICPDLPRASPLGSVDWNCDELIDTMPVTANLDNQAGLTAYAGYDEWEDGHLSYKFWAKTFQYADNLFTSSTVVDPDPVEFTPEEAEELGLLDPKVCAAIDGLPSYDGLTPVASSGLGRLQVAIFGAEDLDVSDIDVTSISLSGAAVDPAVGVGWRILDVDADGFDDLLVEVAVADLLIDPVAEALLLQALTNDDPPRKVSGGEYVEFGVPWADMDVDDVHDLGDDCDLDPPVDIPSPDGCP